MLAPPVAKAQTKTAASPTNKRALQRRTPETSRFGTHDEQESLTALGATPVPSWNFTKVPVSPPDRASRPRARPSLGASLLRSVIQPKLAVGRVDDPLEHEADRIAD